MALAYTKDQAAVIQDGWYAVQRMVESQSKMERRLSLCEKEQRKHFSATASRSHVLHHIRQGMNIGEDPDKVYCDLTEVMVRAGDDDEHVLAMALGMHFARSPHADDMRAILDDVARAETEAQAAYLASL
jgi:hypothetical protein